MKRDIVVVLATLAVIAIWVIFFAIPQTNNWLAYGSQGRCLNEIDNMELALTKIISDAGKDTLRDLFDPVAFQQATSDYMTAHNVNLFEASTALYTRASYALLGHGRGALNLEASRGDTLLEPARDSLDPAVVSTLGNAYLSGLEDDPWGNAYQIFPGPWPEEMGLVLLRSYLRPPEGSDHPGTAISLPPPDVLTVNVEGELPRQQGFPASSGKIVYIWSLGRNNVSDQPRYDPTHAYAPPARSHYRKDATDDYLGGGDDINNWDREGTFMLLYN